MNLVKGVRGGKQEEDGKCSREKAEVAYKWGNFIFCGEYFEIIFLLQFRTFNRQIQTI